MIPSTPSKNNHNNTNELPSFSHSGYKCTKISVDSQGLQVRHDFMIYNKAVILRVDFNPQQVADYQCQNNSNMQQQLKAVIQMIQKRAQQLQLLQQNTKQKKKAISDIMKRIQDKEERNRQLRQLLMYQAETNQMKCKRKTKQKQMLRQNNSQGKFDINNQQRMFIDLQKRYSHVTLKCLELQKIIYTKSVQNQRDEAKLQHYHKSISQKQSIVAEKTKIIEQWNRNRKIIQNSILSFNIQVSVIRMQINHKVRVGFSTVSLDPEGDRKRLLDKGSHIWSRNKTKSFTNQQLRDFILIQLYPHWKKMINKLSSDFKGYRKLLCYPPQSHQQKQMDLSLYLPQLSQGSKVTLNSKIKNVLIFYSPLPYQVNDMLTTISTLAGLQNRVLKIYSVNINSKESGQREIIIEYNYQGTDRQKRIQLIQLKELTRQIVLKALPQRQDKLLMIKFQVPLIFSSSAEKSQYQQVYDMIRRWK